MVVVADASPLIFLSRLGLLEVLPELFGSVTVPRAVLLEVNRGGGSLPGASEINKLPWLQADKEALPAMNLALDNDLIDEAVRLGGHDTKKAAVTEALEEYVRRRQQVQILDLFGTVEWDDDYDSRRQRARN